MFGLADPFSSQISLYGVRAVLSRTAPLELWVTPWHCRLKAAFRGRPERRLQSAAACTTDSFDRTLSQRMKEPNSEETIFAAALALPPEERAACLDKACGNDAELRRRVEVLLSAHAASEFLEAPAAPVAMPTLRISPPLSERAGDRIGRYKLLQQIGEGGCGVVYMAEQDEPVRRRVALKVIKLGMDTKQVIARFEAERQALALMEPSEYCQGV